MTLPKAEALQDRFVEASLDLTLWNDTTNWNGAAFGGPVGFSYNQITCPTGGTSGICSNNSYDLTDSAVSVELVDETEGDNFLLVANGSDAAWFVAGIVLEAITTVSGLVQSVTYNPDLHRFLRICEVNGTFYWDVSRDGVTWRSFAGRSDDFNADSVVVAVYSDGAGLGTNTSQWSNVELSPAGLRVASPGFSAR